MKNIFALALLVMSNFAIADTIITASGTSEWAFASDLEHQQSALANFSIDAFEKCAEHGFSNWRVLSRKCSPSLFGVPCYTFTATVRCYN